MKPTKSLQTVNYAAKVGSTMLLLGPFISDRLQSKRFELDIPNVPKHNIAKIRSN